MNTFYILRHGETMNNRADRLSGWIDTPLAEDGLKPTDRVIAKLQGLPIDAVYSSDLGRAFITAYVVVHKLGLDKEIIRLAGLREVNYGDAANMLSAEAYQRYPGLDQDMYFEPPNGESLHDMQTRVLETVVQLDKVHSDSSILLVAHSGVMAALNANYQGQDFDERNIDEEYPHDYAAVFTVADGKVASFKRITEAVLPGIS